MKNSPIQWCDDTVNPIMACDGCELWPSRSKFLRICKDAVGRSLPKGSKNLQIFDQAIAQTELLTHKDTAKLMLDLIPGIPMREAVLQEILGHLKCYAGKLTEKRAGKVAGYPRSFLQPELFRGRVEKMARARALSGKNREGKPWLDGFPRMVFISDMGDALSRGIGFDDLFEEIIKPVISPHGAQHIWLWLTKRPERMAKFGAWLVAELGAWPPNLVAMTSVTSQNTAARVNALKDVPAHARGLSVEPLFEPVDLELEGIDWVICGGESGPRAAQFDVLWATSLLRQSQLANAAFFLKQLGSNPKNSGLPLSLKNSHGGDWSEWATELRVREVPSLFHQLIASSST